MKITHHSFIITYSLLIIQTHFVRLCHCGNDDERPSSPIGEELVENEDSGFPLDLDSLNGALCKIIPCHDDGNDLLFLVPQRDVIISKIVDDGHHVWSPQPGERFEYCKVYLKGEEPSLIYIVKSTPSGANCRWYTKSGDGWIGCSDNNIPFLEALKVPTEHKGDFSLDISAGQDDYNDHYTTFKANILGALTKMYYPKRGFHAVTITDGSAIIWKASGDEKCTSCNLYNDNGSPFLLITVRDGHCQRFKYYGKVNERWTEMSSTEFNKRLEEARKVNPQGGYKVVNEVKISNENTGASVAEAKPWWATCMNTVATGLSTLSTTVYSVATGFDNSNVDQDDDYEKVKVQESTQWDRSLKEEDEPQSVRRRPRQ